MKRACLFILAALLSYSAAFAQKSDLKILYVGGSSDWSKEHFANDSIAFQKSIQERTKSFEKMLKQYFKSVTVIQAKDYTEAASQKYDVTVMDGTPKPIVPRVTEKDASGNITKYLMEGYLTESFNRPMVTIGELGERLGRRIGLKTDWYCLCLDADAHHLRQEHPIFSVPFPVKLTFETKPTPEDAFHYAYFADGPIPESLPMWKVQTKGYASDNDFRIGMVARPWGFEDSPDAEYISSGVCAKTLDAVAIGRHGNFLHWGFAASPAYMTEEAKAVLANAIVYISQYNGQGVIARKYNDRIATREYLKELKYLSTRESYEDRLKGDEEFNQMYLESQKTAIAKQAKGETLTAREKSALDFKPSPPITFENYIKRYQKDFFPLFGTNVEEYAKFYDANRDYFYSEGFYHIEIDEDVKSLGIPYYDKQLLDEAIKLLESGKDVEKGKRILDRYTLVDFSTPKEWRNWYETYKDRFFFTEPGGYLFLINTREPGANDYHAKEARKAIAEINSAETSDLNPVSVATGIISKENGNKEIVVKVKIHPGYYVYANVAETDPFIPLELNFDLPEGYQAVGNLQKPPFKPLSHSTQSIYEDEIVFVREVTGKGVGEATFTIKYQCCDEHICFLPVENAYSIKL
ncbi:hypothetical protein AGMMS50239_05040 [Bacteroidia bacterium]|nr:hypothetical protein AGMMS50239_05040 [Bacteroidia bacterium]